MEKCFDTLPTEISHGVLRELGMDERVVRPLEGFYEQLSSRLVLNGAVGRPGHRERGAFQGDPLAMLKLNGVSAPLAWRMEEAGVQYWQYCDDPLVLARGRHGHSRDHLHFLW